MDALADEVLADEFKVQGWRRGVDVVAEGDGRFVWIGQVELLETAEEDDPFRGFGRREDQSSSGSASFISLNGGLAKLMVGLAVSNHSIAVTIIIVLIVVVVVIDRMVEGPFQQLGRFLSR